MLMLSTELVNENGSLDIRRTAGLAMKNALTARVRVQFHIFSRSLL
jgi:hypothetical protein